MAIGICALTQFSSRFSISLPSTLLSLLTRGPPLLQTFPAGCLSPPERMTHDAILIIPPKLPPQMTLPGFRGIWQISPWMFWEHTAFVPIVIFGETNALREGLLGRGRGVMNWRGE